MVFGLNEDGIEERSAGELLERLSGFGVHILTADDELLRERFTGLSASRTLESDDDSSNFDSGR